MSNGDQVPGWLARRLREELENARQVEVYVARPSDPLTFLVRVLWSENRDSALAVRISSDVRVAFVEGMSMAQLLEASKKAVLDQPQPSRVP